MADTITINNVGSSAWEATSVNGTNISADTTTENPVINLSNIGTRYIFYNDGYSAHPLEFLDSNGDILLSQSGTGTFESDGSVNWVDNDTSVEFTLTAELSDQITQYRCTVHTAAMAASISSPQTVDYTPSTGSVSITSPSSNATLTNPVSVSMQATDFIIEAASNGVQDGAGHFHILVDQPAVTAGEVIPNNPDNGYYHYGDGSTSAEIDLTTESHTIRLQAGDANHKAYDLTDSVTVTVDEQSSSGTTTSSTNPISVTKDIGHINSVETTVKLENRGTTQTTNTVELVTGTTTIDSQSVTLNVGDTTTITLTDNTFGKPEIGSTRRYEVVTGGREPLIDVNIVGVFKVPAGTQKEIPSFDVSEVRIEQTGEIHFDQTDELKLSQ